MRIVGDRKERAITFLASAELLREGAKFNEDLSRLPAGNTSFIPKGVYPFKNHEEANRHWGACLATGMAHLAMRKK